MKNKDILDAVRVEKIANMADAMKSGDDEAFAQACKAFAEQVEEKILAEAQELTDRAEKSILVSRGCRVLTAKEKAYYKELITAAKSADIKKALSEIETVMPETIIDSVFEELRTEHPLLEEINFQNTSFATKILVNTNTRQLAVWGNITSAITEELMSGFKEIDLTMCKLSAFLPISKPMLELGPEWLDRYIREVLSEALACGLEDGIINGAGRNLNQPIGMIRDMAAPEDQTTGFPEKAAVPMTSLDPVSYGALAAQLAVDSNGNARSVTNLILIVNPIDYLTKIMPATTILNASGQYVGGVLPIPTKIIPAASLAKNKAVIGLPKRYFMGAGLPKSGRIEYSDEYRFLEDERVYLTKFYGNGQPLDNMSFVVLDIRELKAANLRVQIVDGAPEDAPEV